jgi:CRISPR/Cas system CSM-associated protein Csm2 small subunit
MGTLKHLADILDISKEIALKTYKRANEEGRTFREVLDEELKKISYQHTDQSSVSNHIKTFKNIISPQKVIDNTKGK